MNKEELLYHYFSNSLTEAQKTQFNELLETDIEFKEQFDFENNLKRVTKENRNEGLRSKLKSFETEIENKGLPARFNISYWKIAASIALLITAGWFSYQSFFGLSYADIYDENFITYPNTVYTITRSDTTNSKEREAFVAYESKNYKLAIAKFEKAKAKDYFNFYKAQSYMNLKKYEAAEQALDTVIIANKQFVAEAHWYLALIYLKEKDKANAIRSLEILIIDHSYNTDKAKEILEKLN